MNDTLFNFASKCVESGKCAGFRIDAKLKNVAYCYDKEGSLKMSLIWFEETRLFNVAIVGKSRGAIKHRHLTADLELLEMIFDL
jgi:hypothetical protein